MRSIVKVSMLVMMIMVVGLISACQSESQTQRDYLQIVNEQNPYIFGSGYDKALQEDLVYVADVVDGDLVGVEKEAYTQFTLLQYALEQEGMRIGLYDGYRTAEQQQAVYDYYGSLEGWAETNKVMEPGYSEHHTGLLLNVVIWYGEGDDAMWYTETAERQQSIPYFRLLHERLADYGFIDRYPAGHEEHTGMPCEPYEIRYVGSATVAHEIMDNDLCLEGYLGFIESLEGYLGLVEDGGD